MGHRSSSPGRTFEPDGPEYRGGTAMKTTPAGRGAASSGPLFDGPIRGPRLYSAKPTLSKTARAATSRIRLLASA